MRRQSFIVFIFLLTFLIAGSCNNKNRIAGYRISEFPKLCKNEPEPYNGLTTIADPREVFLVKMPYMWDIRELYNDTTYGILGVNLDESSSDIRKLESFTVDGYQTDDSLKGYFLNEILQLKKSASNKVKKLGFKPFAGSEACWVLFETEEKGGVFVNLVIFVKKDNSDEVYHLQSTVFKTDDHESRLCRIMTLFETFKFVDNN